MGAITSLYLVLCALAFAGASAQEDNQCRLWMAPSSTSTESEIRLGLFAGVDYGENETVGFPEVAIPLIDFTDDFNRQTNRKDAVIEFLEGFLWTGEYAGARWEGDHTVTMAIPGFGVLANYHSGTYNLDWEQAGTILRDPAPHFEAGKPHPARGAISPYYNLTMRATQKIRAGSELFANFGDVWDGNSTDDPYQEKLTRWDYMDADRVLDKILDFMKKYDSQMSRETKDEVLDFIMGKILGAAAGSHAKVIRSLIPAHPGKLQTVKDMGGTFAYRNPDLVKTEKWLKKNGVCVDNLESKTSTIPEAGRGAFATRNLKEGSIIAPAPLIQIANDKVLDMFEIKGRKMKEQNKAEPRGQQIVLNYCLGHRHSSALFLPVSPIVNQINHAPSDKANAVMRWSAHEKWGTAMDMLDVKVKDLSKYSALGLIMEIVALRDIKEGEEIFLDYGEDWQAAWDTYMEEWNAEVDGQEWPLRADEVRNMHVDKPYKTNEEQETDPYPEGIQLACFIEMSEMTDGQRKVNDDWNEIALWVGPKDRAEMVGSVMHDCEILSRSEKLDDGFLYNYTVYATKAEVHTEVMNVPHYAITMVDKPYASDIHTTNAFRHYIGIPDQEFPQAWRDRRPW